MFNFKEEAAAKTLTFEVPHGIRYISELSIIDDAMRSLNGEALIVNKGNTGCGGTTKFLNDSNNHCIIAVPNVATIQSKSVQHKNILGIHGEGCNEIALIKDWIDHKRGHVMVTYDSLHLIVNNIDKDVLATYLLIIDEYHLMYEYARSFKTEACNFIYYNYDKFKQAIFMTATPPLTLTDDMEKMARLDIVWPNSNANKSMLVECENGYDLVTAQSYMSAAVKADHTDGLQIVFANDHKFIIEVAKRLFQTGIYSTGQIFVLCSDTDENTTRYKRAGLLMVKELPVNQKGTIIFATSKMFQGTDIYIENDVNHVSQFIAADWDRKSMRYSALTDLKQIEGRIRGYKDGTDCKVDSYYIYSAIKPTTLEYEQNCIKHMDELLVNMQRMKLSYDFDRTQAGHNQLFYDFFKDASNNQTIKLDNDHRREQSHLKPFYFANEKIYENKLGLASYKDKVSIYFNDLATHTTGNLSRCVVKYGDDITSISGIGIDINNEVDNSDVTISHYEDLISNDSEMECHTSDIVIFESKNSLDLPEHSYDILSGKVNPSNEKRKENKDMISLFDEVHHNVMRLARKENKLKAAKLKAYSAKDKTFDGKTLDEWKVELESVKNDRRLFKQYYPSYHQLVGRDLFKSNVTMFEIYDDIAIDMFGLLQFEVGKSYDLHKNYKHLKTVKATNSRAIHGLFKSEPKTFEQWFDLEVVSDAKATTKHAYKVIGVKEKYKQMYNDWCRSVGRLDLIQEYDDRKYLRVLDGYTTVMSVVNGVRILEEVYNPELLSIIEKNIKDDE